MSSKNSRGFQPWRHGLAIASTRTSPGGSHIEPISWLLVMNVPHGLYTQTCGSYFSLHMIMSGGAASGSFSAS